MKTTIYYVCVLNILLAYTLQTFRVDAFDPPSHDLCEADHDCMNGGRCVLTHESFNKCYCASGYKGDICLETCSVLCINDGQCDEDESGQDECQCQSGFTGPLCEQALTCASDDDCSNSQGRCFISRDKTSAECKCNTGFMGEKCSETCPLLCQNGGYCSMDGVGGRIFCECPSGFKGANCELMLNGVNTSNPVTATTSEYVQEEKQNGWWISLLVIFFVTLFVSIVYAFVVKTAPTYDDKATIEKTSDKSVETNVASTLPKSDGDVGNEVAVEDEKVIV